MSSPGKRLVGRLSLARSTPRAYRRHADQEDDEREPVSDSSLPVSRETGPSPRETAAIPLTPVRSARCHYRTCRASPTDSTRSVPPKADVSATSLRGSSTSYPIGHDEFDGSRYRPLGCGIRLLLTCGGLRPTCLWEGRAIASHPAAWSHGFCARRRRQSLTEHCRRTLHHWFHVKPTHKHSAGVMAAPTSFRGPLSQDR